MWWTAQKLKSRGQNTRKRAIEKLGCSEDPRAIVLLAEVLRDQNPLKRDLRIAAVQSLEKIGGQQAGDALTRALRDKDYEVTMAAVRA
jgi:HEAT repeat protein